MRQVETTSGLWEMQMVPVTEYHSGHCQCPADDYFKLSWEALVTCSELHETWNF